MHQLPKAAGINDVFERLAKRVYDGLIKAGQISTDLLKETHGTFMQALLGGYDKAMSTVDYDTPDYFSLRFLKNNLSAFSAAKTMTQVKEMSALLLDANGNKRSFTDFRSEVEKINKEFNVNWLRTEYDTAFSNAQMARLWNDYQANDTMRSLTIRTAGDERVRDTHARYEGFTALKSDSVWKSL